jgi:hypothetical protein
MTFFATAFVGMLLREMPSSVLSVEKKLSATALSQQLPFLLMLSSRPFLLTSMNR